MQMMRNILPVAAISMLLAACGGTDKETIVHDRPVVVEQPANASGMSPSSVESACQHGYDNSTHSCY